jgi:hypothetical protein
MKQQRNGIYSRVWAPLKKWVNKVVKGKDDEDQFNHPYIIY